MFAIYVRFLTVCTGLLFSVVVLAKDLVIFGGSFDPPTSAHISMIQELSNRPDTDVVVMINTYSSKVYHLSAPERAHLLLAGLGTKNKARIVFMAYSPIGAVPVALKALQLSGYDRTYYVIGADVHVAWKGFLPQVGMKLEPQKPFHYMVIPRINTETGLPEPIALKNDSLEEVLPGVNATATSSSQVRKILENIPIDHETSLAELKDVSDGVRDILASQHLYRPRSKIETTYFEAAFVSHFFQLRGHFARMLPQFAAAVKSAALPEFNPRASVRAWDEALVRTIANSIIAEQKFGAYDLKTFRPDGKFPDSLLFFEMMKSIHPAYEHYSPHKEGTFESVTLAQAEQLAYPERFSSEPTTVSKSQLASGLFVQARRKLHDKIQAGFQDELKGMATLAEPRVVFLAGPPGAGKTEVLKVLRADAALNLPVLNIDAFRMALRASDPSLAAIKDPIQFAESTHAESAYLQGIAWAGLLADKKSFIVDGTLSATDYFEDMIGRLKQDGYKTSILYVTAPEEHLKNRVLKRAKKEGRGVGIEKILASMKASEESWTRLSKLVDVAVRIVNPDSELGANAAKVAQILVKGEDHEKTEIDACSRLLVESR